MTLERQLTQLVQDFARRVAELARREALESLRTALGPPETPRLRRSELPNPSLPRSTPSARRTRDDLRAAEQALVEFLRANPGLRVEQINQALGTKSRELALPLRRLVAAGTLRAQGQKRATRYSVAAEHQSTN